MKQVISNPIKNAKIFATIRKTIAINSAVDFENFPEGSGLKERSFFIDRIIKIIIKNHAGTE